MLPGLTPGGEANMTSGAGAVASGVSMWLREPVFPQSNHEQAEPGVVRAASRASVPGPLQGTGRLQGRAHRGNQGEPGPVAAGKRCPPRTSVFCLELEARY